MKPLESEIEAKKKKLKEFVKQHVDSVNPDKFINSIPKSELESYGDSIKCLYTLDIYESYFESKATCNYSEKTKNERYQQINIKTLEANTIERNIDTNHYKILRKRQIRLLSIPDDFEIVEYKNITKLILGYQCFKVLVKKKFKNNSHLTIYDMEMYVTEDINLKFSPICSYKEIINKYYPLEIIRKPREQVMAEVTIWKIKEIQLTDEFQN